jgi:23S rRNA (uracil1939-C5)-methyltransferase
MHYLRDLPDEAPAMLCPHAKACPGCPLIDLTTAEVAAAKQSRVAEAMRRFPELASIPVDDLRSVGPRVAYRQRAKLVADEAGKLGLYRAGTHEVEDLPGCIVLDPLVRVSVARARELLQTQPILRGLDVARIDDGTLVTLITPEHANDAAVQAFASELALRDQNIRGIARSERAAGAVALLGTDLRVLRGATHGKRSLREGGAYTFVSHGSFVQAHREVSAAIQDRLVESLRGAKLQAGARVLELYAGSGALALTLARAGFAVTAIESFAPACQQLREAAHEQGLHVRVETADAARGASRLAAEQQRFDVVMVNPPRRGIDPDVRRALAGLRPRLVTYVSCEPNTLARDLSHLSALGFRVKELVPFDMMPLTEHVETVALLERAEPTPLAVLHEDDLLIAIDKRAHEAALDEGGADSVLARIRRRTGFEQAVAVAALDVAASGICLFARSQDQVAEVELALARGGVAYLALVRGIVRNGGKIARSFDAAAERLPATTRFRRHEVVSGHSLVHAAPIGPEHAQQVLRHFAAIGHPVLGARQHGDARSNRYLELKHMLDRAFLHREQVTLAFAGGALSLHAALAPDLALSLESLRNSRADRRERP